MVATHVCYRHPDRPAGVTCQRCDRPICPACMNQASVGFHCPECVRSEGRQKDVRGRAAFGLTRNPFATQILVAINVAVFFAGIGMGADAGTRQSGFTDDFALFGPCINDREWYRLVTSGFLHAGLVHLLFNMWALYNIGPLVERALGWQRFVVLYFASMLAGSLGALLLTPNTPTVGASGALFGLLGALFVLQRAQGINPWQSGLATTIGLNLLITLAIPFISKGGHIGGLVGGAIVGWVLIELPRRTRDTRSAFALSAALLPVLFFVAVGVASQMSEPAAVCQLLKR